MTYLAVDPGYGGGLAYLHEDGQAVQLLPMPETESDILFILRQWTQSTYHSSKRRAIIEHQVGMVGPDMKVAGTSMFKFGTNYGLLRGMIMALDWPLHEVRPAKWQKELALGAKKDYGKDWKRHLKETAQRLYPGTDGITLKTADALLLFHWGRSQLL